MGSNDSDIIIDEISVQIKQCQDDIINSNIDKLFHEILDEEINQILPNITIGYVYK